jgi:dTDP-4-amino-4,6-dideoxygalactose transaminase
MYQTYTDFFKPFSFVKLLQEPSVDYHSNHWLTTIVIDQNTEKLTREGLRLALEEQQIESRPLWKPMHLQPIFQNYPFYGSTIAADLFEKGLCLPSGSNLTEEDKNRIKKGVLSYLK